MNILNKIKSIFHQILSVDDDLYSYMKYLGDIIEFDDNDASYVKLLAMQIVASTVKQKRTLENTYINANKYSQFDFIIFTYYMLLIDIAAKNNTDIDIFRLYPSINNLESHIFVLCDVIFSIPYDEAFQMFYSRIHFYNEITKENINNIETLKETMLSEIQNILKTDKVYNKFIEWSSSSPLVILGINDEIQCNIEVMSAYKSFDVIYSDTISKINFYIDDYTD